MGLPARPGVPCCARCASSAWRPPSSARTASCPMTPGQGGDPGRYGLQAVGQFVPVVLHDPGHDPLPEVERAIAGLVAAQALHVRARRRHRPGRLRRPPDPRRRRLGDPAGQPRPDRRRCVRPADSWPRCTRTSARWWRAVRRPTGVLAGSRIGAVPGHRAPAHRRRRPGRRGAASTPSGSPTSISRTSALDWAGRVRSGEVTYTEAVARRHVRPARRRATSTSRPSSTALEGNGYAGLVRPRTGHHPRRLRPARRRPGPVADVRASIAHLLAAAGRSRRVGWRRWRPRPDRWRRGPRPGGVRPGGHGPVRGGHLPARPRRGPGGRPAVREVPRRQRDERRGGRRPARPAGRDHHPDRPRPLRPLHPPGAARLRRRRPVRHRRSTARRRR